jgi:bifunctional non-homologous end joining protein LigD
MHPWPSPRTGGKGLHLMVPIEPRITHDQAREYCRKIAEHLVAGAPDKYTTSPDPKARTKRIYIDYLRNGRGSTAIGAFSPRARHGLPIAAPVTWNNVECGIGPDAYAIKRLPSPSP